MDQKSHKPLMIGLAILAILWIFGGRSRSDKPEPTSTAPAPVAPAIAPVATRPANADARLEECRAKLKAAVPLDLITNMSYEGGHPKLWVGPTWHKIPIDTKEGLAREAACFFLAGDETKAIQFPIFDGMTGKEIATWKYTKLEVE